MKRANQKSESGMTRREWRDHAKRHVGNIVLATKADFYDIARRSIFRGDGSGWRDVYACGRLANLNDNGKALLPRLP